MDEVKQLSIIDRWEMDIESYGHGKGVLTSTPQCEKCKYFIKKNALYCEKFQEEKKPKFVMFPEKECPEFDAADYMKIEIEDQEKSRILGGLFGLCIGDALGVPVEFSSRSERKKDLVQEMRAYGTYHQPYGTWSDDTSLTLCLLDSLINDCTVESIKNNFVDFYKKAKFTPHGIVFDIGISTKNAIEKMMAGVEPLECGGKSEYDNGNGSLMRVLPLSYSIRDLSFEKQKDIIEKISSLTHAHKRSKLACIIYIMFAIELLNGVKKEEAYKKIVSSLQLRGLTEYDAYSGLTAHPSR